MRHQERNADDFPRSLAEHFAHRNKIALGFGHLAAADRQHAVVQPVPRERVAAVGTDALGNLVLMVREDQIETAAMDVERLAEFSIAHRGAFDMPTRAAATPRAVPARYVRA